MKALLVAISLVKSMKFAPAAAAAATAAAVTAEFVVPAPPPLDAADNAEGVDKGEIVKGGDSAEEETPVSRRLSNFPVDGSYFRGRPRDKCLRFKNSRSSTVQKLPKSSS